MSEPDADLEALEPYEPVASRPRSARQSLVLLLGVFFVATICLNLWPDESSVASSAEATGIPAEAVIASLAAERREHAARWAATAASSSTAPANGETRSQAPGGEAGSKDEQGQASTPETPAGGSDTPAKGNLTLPIVGETPLPEPEVPLVPLPDVPLPDASVPGVSTPPLPALADVEQVAETLLP